MILWVVIVYVGTWVSAGFPNLPSCIALMTTAMLKQSVLFNRALSLTKTFKLSMVETCTC